MSHHLRIPGDSVETIRIPVAALDSAGALEDPTAVGVEIGFSTDRDIEPDTWHTAAWETSETVRAAVGATVVNTPYKATVLVGAGATDLDPGDHAVWVKISDSPEIPVRYAGQLEVF